MKDKIFRIIEGAIIVIFGILFACKGSTTAVDTYFGVVFMVVGILMAALAIVGLLRTKLLPFGAAFSSTSLIVVGVALLNHKLTFGVLIAYGVYVLLAFGIALAVFGLYTILKGELFNGLGQIVVGAVIALLAILYLNNADFHKVFETILGIVIAVYGALIIVLAFLDKKEIAE